MLLHQLLLLPLLNKTSIQASAALLCLTFSVGGAAFSKSSTTDDASVHSSSTAHSSGHSTRGTRHSSHSNASSTQTTAHLGHSTTHSHLHGSDRTTNHDRLAHDGESTATHSGAHSRLHSRTHSAEHVVEETQTVAVVSRDRHGHKHTVFKKLLVPVTEPIVAMHKVSKRVALMVKDRHGHMHKIYRTELVEVADVHAHGHGIHSGVAHSQNEDNDDDRVKKVVHDDGEPKSDGVEPERFNPSYGKAYALYDEGANARISGDYPLAISNLGRALAVVPTNSHGGPSVLQLNMEYDLAQAAEAQGDMALAARYYARALSDRPNFTEAAVRLATVLAKAGNYGDALRAARSAVQRSPNDPRTHAVLSVLLEKAGSPEEAKSEKQKSKALMANIKSLDTAPLVSPEAAPPVRREEDSDMTSAGNDKGDSKGDMKGDLKGDMKGDMIDDSTK
jgi:hypothetical protein